MEDTSTGAPQHTFRATLMRAAVFGATFATVLVLAAVVAVVIFSKEKPWNSQAVTAQFIEMDTLAATATFRYALSNNSGNDLTVSKESVKILFRQKSCLRPADGLATILRDVFLPDGPQIELQIQLPVIALDPEFATLSDGAKAIVIKQASESSPEQNANIQRLFREELTGLEGFVLFDGANRIEINLPRGW